MASWELLEPFGPIVTHFKKTSFYLKEIYIEKEREAFHLLVHASRGHDGQC